MEAVDILLMAKGSAAEVGYKTDAELIGDICDLNYDEYSRGLIHSHQWMSTTWSGTDHEQLKLAASTGPYYLSVVVNNNMEFNAKVAIKSTEKYKGYSFFKNLLGKEVKSPKELTKESYEVIDVEMALEFPQYMIDVDKRIKDKLQNYVTPTYERSGFSYVHPKYSNDYNWDSPVINNFKQTGSTSLLKNKLNQQQIAFEEDLDAFVEEALKKYTCAGLIASPQTIAENIIMDKEHYGIALNDYIEYLEINIVTTEEKDKEIIRLLKEYGK